MSPTATTVNKSIRPVSGLITKSNKIPLWLMPSQAFAQWQWFNLSYLPLRGQHWNGLYGIQTAPVSRLTLKPD